MTDQYQAFILNNHEYRGVIVHLESSYQKIIHMHEYPEAIARHLGELLAAAALLGNNLKQKGRLALQIETAEHVKFLVAEINDEHGIRGLAQWRNEFTMNDEIFSSGKFALTMMPEHGERYQGIVPLVGHSIAKSLEAYFTQSEQVVTRLILAANNEKAAGLLLQKLPASKDSFEENKLDPTAIQLILDTVRGQELLYDSPATLLRKLFHDCTVEVFPHETIRFSCTCSREKMESAIRLMGKEEANEILSTHKTIDVTCDFCNDHYGFDRAEVDALFG